MAAPQFIFDKEKITFDYFLNGTAPATQTVNVQHPAVFDGSGDYDLVYAKYSLVFKTGSVFDWISNSNDWLENSSYDLYDGLNEDLTFGIIKAIADISYPSNLVYFLKLETIGYDDATSEETILATNQIQIVLRLIGATGIQTNPPYIELIHYKNTPVARSQILTITGNSWVLKLLSALQYFNVTPLSNDITYVQLPHLESYYKGSSGGQLKLTLKPEVDAFALGDYDYLTIITTISNPEAFLYRLSISVRPKPELYVTPESFYFKTVIGFTTPAAQEVYINKEGVFNFDISDDWISIAPPFGTDEGYFAVQVTMPPGGMTGIYTGTITVTTTTSLEFVIPITHEVIELATALGPINFTLDENYINVFTETQNTFFELQLLPKTYDYYQALSEYVFNYKLPLFNYFQKMNVGEIMHRLIKPFPVLTLGNDIGKIHTMSVVIKEIDNTTGVILNQLVQQNLQFVPGYRPEISADDCYILNRNTYPTRITPNSIAFLNLFFGNDGGNYPMIIYKNGTDNTIFGENIEAIAFKIISRKIDFSALSIRQGDVLEVRVLVNETEYLSQKYIVFPEAKYSHTIVWEDEYKNRQALECTGDYMVKDEKEFVTHKYQRNLVEYLKKLKTNHDCKLQINTGWLLASDQITVDNLMESKRAWLVLNAETNDFMELVCISKSIDQVDSERALISFDLEFQINKTSYAKIYNF